MCAIRKIFVVVRREVLCDILNCFGIPMELVRFGGRDGWGMWHVVKRTDYKILVGNSKKRDNLANPRLGLKHIIKTNFKGIGCESG